MRKMDLLVAKNNRKKSIYTIAMDKLSPIFLKKTAIVAALAFVVINFAYIRGTAGSFLSILQPVFIGIIIALILNVPMEIFDKKVFKKIKKDKLRSFLSLVLSVMLFAGVVALVFGLALPAGIDSVKSLIASGDGSIWERLQKGGKVLQFIGTYGKILYDDFTSKIQDYLPKMLKIAQNIFKVAADVILGLGIAIMLLANKKNLTEQAKKLLNAIFKERKKVVAISEVTGIAINKFSRYLGGQIIEDGLLSCRRNKLFPAPPLL